MRRAIAFGVLVVLVGLLGVPAGAQAPDQQGWWWQPQTNAVPGVAVPTPPWVPPDGLYVAGTASQPEAVSALRYTLPADSTVTDLVLTVAGSPRGTPIVGACLAIGRWAGQQGGPYNQRPGTECTATTAGTVSEDGTTVTFPVAGLVRGRELNIAIVPGTDETGASAPFQLAFEKPTDTALTVVSSSSSSSSGSGETTPAASPSPAPSPAPVSTFTPAPGVSSFTSPPPMASVASPLPDVTTSAPVSGTASGVGLQPVYAPPAATGPVVDDGGEKLGLIGLIALAAAYVRLSQRGGREPTPLVTFGRAEAEAST